MKITVTPKHIERGIHGKSTHCALAIAINEQLPGCEAGVGVGSFWVQSLLPKYPCFFLDLPYSAQEFVIDFDCRRFDSSISPNTVQEPACGSG